MLRKLLCAILGLFLLVSSSNAQDGALDPADPDMVFTTTNQPALPAWNTIAKWGHTNRLSWANKTPFQYGYKCYYYNGMVFRIKFPKSYQHNVADGKKYPMLMFLHGLGEKGTLYDNEYQLLHGGSIHADNVNNGNFDGFLFYPQNTTGFYTDGNFINMTQLIDSFVKYIKLDIDRIVVSGLSAGGQATWGFTAQYPKLVSAAMPISAASLGYIPNMPNHITVPFWLSNGGTDAAPAPYTVTEVITAYNNLGGYLRQFFYPTLGHGVWNTYWNESEYFPSLSTFHKANPLVYFGRTEFCPGDPISVRMGLQAGFFAYEWRKNGVTISGATASEYTATSFGTYSARFKRTSTGAWSEWSPAPIVVQEKTATVTPPISIDGMRSNVLPAPDGSTTVPLSVPTGYTSYEWRRVSDNALMGTTNVINAGPGSYRVRVTEQFGCSSSFSPDYVVINAAGSNLPDAASNPTAMAVSNSSLRLDWSENPNPVNNETGYEIYRSTTSGGPYTLITITGQNVLTYTDLGLTPAAKYYYLIRAINGNGAGANSPEFSGTTQSDSQIPTAPTSLAVVGTSRSSVSLSWVAATDDVGIDKYDIYINGNKAYTTSGTSFTVNGLEQQTAYGFSVRARDFSGNISAPSNQVNATTIISGFSFKYVEGTWNNLPNFTTTTAVKTGYSNSFDIVSERLVPDGYGFLWEGVINIPTSGTYNFRTNSDDGSRLWLGARNTITSPYSFSGSPTVNNDGVHGAQNATSSNLNLTAGTYPIAVAFFDRSSGESLTVSWRTPSTGTSYVTIPLTQFTENFTAPGGSPANPSNLVATSASYNKINLTWTDNSNNENGFEIWRSTESESGFSTVGFAAANATSFVDSFSLAPSTRYYYRLRAVGSVGASAFIPVNSAQANWKFNGNYDDATGNGRTVTPNNTPTFNSSDKQEGSHAVEMNGSTQDLTVTTATGDYIRGGYNAKTVAFWMKADVTSSNRGVFDLGGNDDGLAMYINANQLIAGVASNNTRRSLTTPYTSTGWNHIALVYSGSTLRLYVNGTEVASNTSLGFSSLGTTTDASMIGDDNGTNALNTGFGQFDGKLDNFMIYGKALSATEVVNLMNNVYDYSTAVTAALPAIPGAPTSLNASGISAGNIELSWNDNSNNETEFEIYRSVGDNSNYRLLATRTSNAGATATYVDEGLFSNVLYYYQVRAKGVGGLSAFTNEASSRTLNTIPVINSVSDFTIRYDVPFVLNLSATDGDGENLTLDPGTLPSFAAFAATGNGTGTITFNANISQLGSYPVRVIVTDVQGGKDTADFVVTVNSNYVPTINTVSNITLDEGGVQVVNLTANDQDGNAGLVWDGTGLPAFVQLNDLGNGQATLTLSPGYAAAGAYTIGLKVNDGNGGSGTSSFVVTINDKDPGGAVYYVNMLNPGFQAATSPWNNVSSTATVALANAAGQTGPVTFSILDAPWNSWYEGATTGNNSGILPDDVIRDYYFFGIFGAPETVQFRLAGLPAGYKYNLRLMASSRWTGVPDNGSTVFTIGAESHSLNTQNNNQNLAVFTGLTADANGYITVTMSKAPGAPVGYLNGFILEQVFDDGTSPVLPTGLSAQNLPDGTVGLQWTDVAYNETRYEVYRSTSENGVYTLLNPGADNANTTSYVDATVLSSTTYYYKIAAVNAYGTSNQTSAVSVTTGNKAPVFPAVANQFVKSGNSSVLNLTATDDAGDVLTLTIANLPAFASYINTGNGTGTININPGTDDLGIYKGVKVTVTDNFGASVERLFDISVTDNGTRSWYLNVVGTKGTAEGQQPWNELGGFPFSDLTLSNLKDDNDATTSVGFRLVQNWSEGWNGGMVTGNNSGVFNDNVLKSSIYEESTSARDFQLTGLNTAKRYNVAILSSNNSGFNTQATWTSGAQSKTFNAAHNSNKLIQLNGLTPDANGTIQVTMTKAAAARFAFFNALVLEEYDASTTPVRPLRLFTETEGQRVRLKWSDRSYNETGFQIWRSESGGSFSLLTTVGVNVESYTDNSVSTNRRYQYRVRAINGAINSGYSNTANAMIAERIVYVNFTGNQTQGSPWNNTTIAPFKDQIQANLLNSQNINTGISLEVTQNFGGTFDVGTTTGTDYPDNVMLTSWWVEGRGDETGIFKLKNLNQAKHYRIGITGSSAWEGDFSGIYTINGTHRYLNTHLNENKAVYFEHVVPNENGEITLSMTGESFANWAFIGGLIIESYDDDGLSGEAVISNGLQGETGYVAPDGDGDALAARSTPANTAPEAVILKGVRISPNPFINELNLQINLESEASHLSILMVDLSGKLVYRKELGKTSAGPQLIRIGAGGELSSLKTGVYILNINNNGQSIQTFKLLKNR
ncbi:MAG: fibronectin type III domain-containing protein [Chitinophagaceae bacterium]|nr:fibronectin type III domain-containing protein [Chitinophagaceae bacterium]